MISILVPFYNEAENLPILIKRLIEVIKKLDQNTEIILIDDGSTDDWKSKLGVMSNELRVIKHRKRLGKGQALLNGFKQSKGDIIVFIDADLQNDPEDLPKLLEKIDDYDFVNGWRKDRIDPISKTLPSSIFNFFILKLILRSKFHDVNCGLKVMRREVLETIPLYGDNYRFLPIIAEKEGFRTTEVEIKHHPRKFGKSKYGIIRLLFGLFDTLTTYFIYTFSEKPNHFFGPVGLIIFIFGFIITFYLVFQRIFFGVLLYRRPSLLIGILMVIVGIQIIMTGVIGELIVYLNKKK